MEKLNTSINQKLSILGQKKSSNFRRNLNLLIGIRNTRNH